MEEIEWKKVYGKSGIYQIRNIVNGKIYIGSAVNLVHRKATHFMQLNKQIHVNRFLQRAYNKYKKESFVFYIMEIVDDKTKLIEREQFYIDSLSPQYNICQTAGSSLGQKQSVESIAKRIATRKLSPKKIYTVEERCRMSAIQLYLAPQKSKRMRSLASNPDYHQRMSDNGYKNWENEEYKKKQREGHLAVVSSIEHREKLSASQRKRYKDNPDSIEQKSQQRKELLKDPLYKEELQRKAKLGVTDEVNKRRGENIRKRKQAKKEGGDFSYRKGIVGKNEDGVIVSTYNTTVECIRTLGIGYGRLVRSIENKLPINNITYYYAS